jgi:hypothetical protein
MSVIKVKSISGGYGNENGVRMVLSSYVLRFPKYRIFKCYSGWCVYHWALNSKCGVAL